MNGCEPPCGFWDLNSGPLEEQLVLLPTEPFYQAKKISDLIIRGKIKLCQILGTDSSDIIVPYSNAEIMSL